MKVINQKKDNFFFHLNNLIQSRVDAASDAIDSVAKNIINEVKLRGDEALIEFAKEYDNNSINKSQILISDQLRSSYQDQIDQNVVKSFEVAIENITTFHKKQLPQNYEINKNNLS